jgi:hypothetical protein
MISNEQINKYYKEISDSWNKNLKQYGVKLPKLIPQKYSKDVLVLIYLFSKIEQKVSKQELTEFLKSMGHDSIDVQQARHLAQQSGWYILSGTRKDNECKKYNINPGEYLLKSISEPYPSFKILKRTESLNASSWEELKSMYNNRCATCGSKEGETNFLYPASVTRLQQGHKDPSKPLTIDNTIPQCSFCNQASRDYFIFDNKGRVEKIHDPHFILRSDKEIQETMLKLLIGENISLAKDIIEELNDN